MKGVKSITVLLEDGKKIIFEPKFPVSITIQKGTKWIPFVPIPESVYNGMEVLTILSVPEPILKIVKEQHENLVERLINS